MTNKEALDLIQHKLDLAVDDASIMTDKEYEVFSLCAKALEQESCEEQEIYEKAYKEGYDKGWSDGKFIGKNRWIPASERLPKDRREVLVTAYWHETYQVMMASYFGDGLWWCVPFNNCGEHTQRLKPKAWMPLPEPYKTESEG